jgi:hypothetical protein
VLAGGHPSHERDYRCCCPAREEERRNLHPPVTLASRLKRLFGQLVAQRIRRSTMYPDRKRGPGSRWRFRDVVGVPIAHPLDRLDDRR